MTRTQRRIFLVWGCVIALLVVLTIPFAPEKRPGSISSGQWLLWIGAYLSFLGGFWLATRSSMRWSLVVWQTLSVIAIISTRPALGLEGALFVLVAFQLAAAERRVALAWITAQSIALFAILGLRFGFEHAMSIVAAYFPFQLLAFYTSRLVAREAVLVAANARAEERLRIARELHDVVGHRLAAISVNLEAASHVAEKQPCIDRAHASAKALLGDVRDVVGNLRRETPVDVGDLLRSVLAGIPQPSIHVDCGDVVVDPNVAQLLAHCAQEVVTNSIKHASSDNIWLDVQASPNGLKMIARDDGRGAREWREGNGLRGIRERVEIAGGSMQVETRQGSGFHVQLFVPS